MDSKWTVTECLKERKRGLRVSFMLITFIIINNNKSISEIIKRNIVRVDRMNLSKLLKISLSILHNFLFDYHFIELYFDIINEIR